MDLVHFVGETDFAAEEDGLTMAATDKWDIPVGMCVSLKWVFILNILKQIVSKVIKSIQISSHEDTVRQRSVFYERTPVCEDNFQNFYQICVKINPKNS